MKLLLAIMAIFEGLTGAALLIMPTLTITLLLGAEMQDPAGLIGARIAGAALFSLAILCSTATREKENRITIVAAMLFYNIAAEIVLVYAAAGLALQSKFLWPAILAHQVLGVWCAFILLRRRVKTVPS